MTPADWKTVETRLGLEYHPVELLCDGYRVRLELQRVGKMRLAITFFINGWQRGEWLLEDCEERRRFHPVSYRNALGRKTKNMYRSFPKRLLKEFKIDLDKKRAFYGVYWKSFASMKRHFIKNNKSIELIAEQL